MCVSDPTLRDVIYYAMYFCDLAILFALACKLVADFSAPRFLIICLLCLVFDRFPCRPLIKDVRPEHFYVGGSSEIGEVPDVEMEMSDTPGRNARGKRFGGDIFEDFRRIRTDRAEVSKLHRLYFAF